MSRPQLADLPQGARVLAIRLSAMGDIVFALPALAALKQARPDLRVDWLVEDRFAAVLEHHPLIDEVLIFPRKGWRSGRGIGPMWQHLRKLRKQRDYALVLDFQSNLKSALQLLFVRSKQRVGLAAPLAREGAQRFHHVHAEVTECAHRSERDAALLHAVGWQGSVQLQLQWPLPSDVVNAIPAAAQDFTLLHTGVTAYGKDKEWPAEQWIELARALLKEGHQPRLLWTPPEKEAAEAIAHAAGNGVELAPATPSINHLMALTDQARLLIGTDSGPVHLAAYRGTPVVALFGPTDPQVYAPPGTKVQIVYAGKDGEAPPPRDRSKRSPWMEKIGVAKVLAASEEALANL
ncbi:MAG: glycosyltransferase family 9 protein [Planctomycetes bacterium]|nr:glycosyltransferase family 9 protein [Planctomycetota bacterium]MCP4770584.1 glycosyltransferase family 9 protein [Planctomycetota bacterium]MCP4861087.1 glycosyltransferase family 9 protein [Planctomycetota bacterium]